LKKIIIFTLIIFVVVLAIIHDRNNYLNSKLDVPTIDDIASVILSPSSLGGSDNAIRFNLHNDMQRITVVEILYWLNHSKIIGEAKNQLSQKGVSPTSLHIVSKNGKELSIEDGMRTFSTKLNSRMTLSKLDSIKNQVTVYMKNKAIRVESPELKEWIEKGWQDWQKK
jgi:hypothetical protein